MPDSREQLAFPILESAHIERLRAILGSDELLLEVIKGELLEIKAAYGDERRTEIIPDTGEISVEDMIAEEDMVITVTNSGYEDYQDGGLSNLHREDPGITNPNAPQSGCPSGP